MSSPPEASWHADYRDTAYIYIGGLPFELTEGDILTIFSQFGEPVHLNLVRDKDTGKSKGFAFLKYEDQRSTDLAVDNLGGASVMGRLLRVDHVRYKRREEEGLVDNLADVEEGGGKGEEMRDVKKQTRRTGSESDGEERRKKKRPRLKEEKELARLIEEHDDEDPMKEFLIQEKKEEVEMALEKVKSSRHRGESEEHRRHHRHHRHHHRHRHDRSRSRDKRRSRSRSGERRRHKERRDRDRSR
jgi:RNA-binding motif X-linked protein 2